MAITGVVFGAATTGVNASVTPAAVTGVAVGDFVGIIAAIRQVGATVNTPTGWTRLTLDATTNFAAFGRFWQTGDSLPLVSFTGGVALADTYAKAFKATGVALDQLAEHPAVQQTNVSTANIAYPAYDVLGAAWQMVMALWKQDDATSIAAPGGWTTQGLTNMTTGDDMLVQLYNQQQTTESDIVAGSAVVTGGVAAVSKAFILGLKPAPSLLVQSVNLFPPRTQITVSGLATGDNLEIYRVDGGVRTLVRGATVTSATDPAFVVVDGEVPFGTPVSYEAVVNGFAVYASGSATYSPPGGKAILSDAISGAAAEFIIVSWAEKDYEPQASIFKVGGRNVVVTGEVGQFEATIEVYFEAFSSTDNFLEVLNTATEGILQLRAPDNLKYQGVDCFVSVVSAREKRFSQDGSDGRRTWQLQIVETSSWSSGQAAKAFTLQDIADVYTGQTLADYSGDYATMLSAAQADYS